MRGRKIISLACVAIVISSVCYGLSLASDGILRSMEEQFTRIVDNVSPAIVEITATKTISVQPSPAIHENVGTGIIFDTRGYIVTTESVVGGAGRIGVTLADGRDFRAYIVGADPETDLALVRIDADALPIVPLGNSDGVRAGSWVINIGRSYGMSPTLSFGVVSGLEPLPGRTPYYDAIKINASVSPGNSGGGVIDMDGQVVGIITAALAEPRAIDFEPLSSAIELSSALRQAKSAEKLAKARLYSAKSELERQKSMYEAALSIRQDLENARVKYAEAQSEYEEALVGLERQMAQIMVSAPPGNYQPEIRNLLMEIEKIRKQLAQECAKEDDLGNIKKILERKDHLGDITTLLMKVQEAGSQIQFRAPRARFFGRQEESFAIPINFARGIINDLMDDGKVERGWLGVIIRPVTHSDMGSFGLDTMEGVIVVEVIDRGPAARAGILKDDVIIRFSSEKVRRNADLVRMVATTRPHANVDLTIVRDKKKRVLNVQLGRSPEQNTSFIGTGK